MNLYQIKSLRLLPVVMTMFMTLFTTALQAQTEIELRTDGIVVPRTDTSSVSSPVEGMMIYDTLCNSFKYFDGIAWQQIGSGNEETVNSPFERVGTVVRQTEGVDTDDFVFGRDGLPPFDSISDALFFFDKSNRAFRAGSILDSDAWSPSDIGDASVAMGRNTIASGDQASVALGNFTVASGGFGATALGNATRASGSAGATAMGYFSEATGRRGATALGNFTVASGDFGATALGNGTQASGDDGATALGDFTEASGDDGATALGSRTEASGDDGATALGRSTTASGADGATALGSLTTASGDQGATALGFRTIAAGDRSVAMGQYNDTIVTAGTSVGTDGPLLIVGNGTSNSNRNNALVVRQNGQVEFDNYTFPIPDGSNGQVMTTDGSGQLSWVNDADSDSSNEIQTLALSSNILSLSDGGGSLSLTPYLDNTDDWSNNASGISYNLGSVGIGTLPTTSKLQINHNSDSTSPTLELRETSSTDFARLAFSNTSGSENWRISGRPRATGSQSSANLNFFYSDGTGDVLRLIGNGNAILAGTLTENSDVRLKKDIIPLTNALSSLTHISGYRYNWKDKNNTDDQIGLIAQEVQALYPELVLEDDEGMLSVSYSKMVPVLLEAIKEQQEIITSLEARLTRNKVNDERRRSIRII